MAKLVKLGSKRATTLKTFGGVVKNVTVLALEAGSEKGSFLRIDFEDSDPVLESATAFQGSTLDKKLLKAGGEEDFSKLIGMRLTKQSASKPILIAKVS